LDDQPITLKQLFNAPAAKVWQAITDVTKMKRWYFDLPEFIAEVGFSFQFTGGPSPDKQYVHLCEITAVVPEKKLSYSWRYAGYPGSSLLTFELFEQESKTLLHLTHQGIETFPAENADFAKKNFEQGWNEIIHNSLKNYLERKD
jgi:uncharacterized protein YndB with AHSA1/START domain